MPLARQRQVIILLCFVTDALLLWLSLSLAALSRTDTLIYLDDMRQLYAEQMVLLALYLGACIYTGAYQPSRITDRFDTIYFVSLGLVATAVLSVLVASILPRDYLAISRRELLLAPVIGMAVVSAWRFLFCGIAPRFASMHQEFHIFGSGPECERLAEEITGNDAYWADAHRRSLEDAQAEFELARAEGRPNPFAFKDAIIASTNNQAAVEEAIKILEFCENSFGRVYIYPTLHDMLFFPHSDLKAVAGIPLVELKNRQTLRPYTHLKRLVDLGVSLIGLLLALPICIVTALAVKLTSSGPIFYTQERMGLNGRRFNLYKFRSMTTDAETKSGPVWATANDARVTPVGRFIRKHRIDEIPQLINVLKGDMSLIGPRPERPHFHQEFCEKWPLFDRRLEVRPGVTSLSHVLGSYSSEPEDRLRYDLMYISSLSPLNDIRILFATVRVVLGAKGAQ